MVLQTSLANFVQNRRSIIKQLGAAAVGLSFTSSLVGCSGGSNDAKLAATGEEAKLSFYTWDTYIGENTIADFNKASGIDVNISLFATNDEMIAKFRTGNPGFDVIVPANDTIERMIAEEMLQPLDHSKIPNFKNVGAEFIDPVFDAGRKYSMPYTWLIQGIGYRKSKVKSVPDSWKYVFDSDMYKGRVALPSEAADLFHLGAKYLGHSLSNLSPALIKQIEEMLIRQKPNLKTFHEDNGQDLLLSGEIDIVLEYNGDIAQIMREDDDIGFVVPREGSQLNSDNLCIPKNAPHPKNAHAFINYLLDAEVGKEITETILYPTPNAAARKLMPASYGTNPVIFPSAQIIAKSEYARYDREQQLLFEAAITRIRAA
jgi:spermidine/putrescine transport system substrate-binding protein